MFPLVTLAISPSTMRALLNHHARNESPLNPAELADLAITEWLARQQAAPPAATIGYQWKQLFLPDGTRLRITTLQHTCYASIEGDQLMYGGVPVSPNQMTSSCMGAVRNAWEAIWIQMPGEHSWRRADQLRRAVTSAAKRAELQAANAAETVATNAAGHAAAGGAAASKPPPARVAAPDQERWPTWFSDGKVTPQQRPDAQDRRQTYRRAEDLMLD